MLTLVVWDSDQVPHLEDDFVYSWGGYSEHGNLRSLLRYTEANADRLRSKYLSWVDDLGNKIIVGKPIIEHLALKEGFSYWWMSLLVEKSPYKSPISDVVRIFALEEIVLKEHPDKIVLISENPSLHQCIREICKNLKIHYAWKRPPVRQRKGNSLKEYYGQTPNPGRAIFTLLKYVLRRWALKRGKVNGGSGGGNSLFLSSYFIHLHQELCSRGTYYSHQWESFPDVIHSNGLHINWIHHFLKSPSVPNTSVAINWIARFNRRAENQDFHAFLDSFLSFGVLFRVFMFWLRLAGFVVRCGRLKMAFQPRNSHFSVWPLQKMDWYDSMCGPTAVMNLLTMELFDVAMRNLPHQRVGLYLCENQSWERALIYAWRKNGHGRLIGVAHSTVRFWDLRYFAGPKSRQNSQMYLMPQPDFLALNGEAAVEAYREADQPMDNVIKCEALRYLHLGYVDRSSAIRSKSGEYDKVLILGDIMHVATKNLLALLNSAAGILPDSLVFTFKPHPACMIETGEFEELRLTVVTDALGDIIEDYDIAYASNSTSAAVDAYIAGLPVVVMLDDNELNMSPLRGQPGVQFVSEPSELAKAFSAAKNKNDDEASRKDFFFLDGELPRWRRHLNLNSV